MQFMAIALAAVVSLSGHAYNRLAASPSPAIRYHAHDPAPWQPFDQRAFARAARHDRLITILVISPDCPDCRRAAHRLSGTDSLRLTVPVMLDATRNPFTALRLSRLADTMNRQEPGLPLTVILTPDGLPVYAERTWQDPDSFAGMPRVFVRVDRLWREARRSVRIFGNLMLAAAEPGRPEPITPMMMEQGGE